MPTQKYVYEAELVTDHFKRGVRDVQTGTREMAYAAGQAVQAFSLFRTGQIPEGMTRLASSARHAASAVQGIGVAAVSAGRELMGALSGGLSILMRYASIGTVVTGIITGLAAKLGVLDSAKFESEVGRAAILSQANPSQRAEMLKHARDIGLETPFGPQAVAESMKVEAQRGRSPDEIIALTEATKRFAVIANIDMAQAAETLSEVMFQFDIPMKDATRTALMLSNAVTATALSGRELFDAMKFAGGAAGVFKVSLTEILAVLGTLRRVTDPSTASTAVRNIMLIGSALKEKSPKKLEALGIDEQTAAKFSFMSGEAKSLVDVVKQLHELFKEEPELAMKAGFGTRTLVAFEQIAQFAGRADGFYEKLGHRIEDTDLAQRQYNESIQLADNIYRRLETTAGAAFMAIGSKLREAFALDETTDSLTNAIGEITKQISAMPKENVRQIVDSLGAGMVDAFGVGIAFLVNAIPAVALLFGDLLWKAISSAASHIMDSDEFKNDLVAVRAMSPIDRARLNARLLTEEGDDPTRPWQGVTPAQTSRRRMREALTEVEGESSYANSATAAALEQLRAAAADAVTQMRENPTVRAVGAGLAAGRESLAAGGGRGSRRVGTDFSRSHAGAEGVTNNGVMNVYGAFSGDARAKPARPSGMTPQERAAR